MDLDQLRARVNEAIAERFDHDWVAVSTDLTGSGLEVSVLGRRRETPFNQWARLGPDGRLHEAAPDDGWTSLGAAGTDLGGYAEADAAFAALLDWIAAAVARYRRLAGIDQPPPPRPKPCGTPPDPVALADACTWWQSDRDGSSLLRAAARALTERPHYFRATFIETYEAAARQDPRALAAAAVLLQAVTSSPLRTAAGWNQATGLPDRSRAGRGLKAKTGQDEQIAANLATGRIVMPLWGVSLDPDIARSYGTRWLLQIEGDFPGIPAWTHSGTKAEEQEIITGGTYRVLDQRQQGETTVVTLRCDERVGCRVAADPLLFAVMAEIADQRTSSVSRGHSRDGGGTALRMTLRGGQEILIDHPDVAPDTVRVQYDGKDFAVADSDYATMNNWYAQIKHTHVPAEVDAIMAWLRPQLPAKDAPQLD